MSRASRIEPTRREANSIALAYHPTLYLQEIKYQGEARPISFKGAQIHEAPAPSLAKIPLAPMRHRRPTNTPVKVWRLDAHLCLEGAFLAEPNPNDLWH